jgi:hypothetical protein
MTAGVMTRNQFDTAYTLARAYGHEWAMVPDNTWWSNHDGNTGRIREITLANGSAIPGIQAPRVDDAGNVVHTTGSGRLSWAISPDGATTLLVRRPYHGSVLRANVGDGIAVERLNPDVPIHTRHVEALRRPLAILCGNTAALEAVAGVLAGALPEPPAPRYEEAVEVVG